MENSKQLLRDEVKELRRQLAKAVESKAQSEEIIQQLQYGKVVFENTSESVIICDSEAKIISVNKSFTDITGYKHREVIGKTPSILNSRKHNEDFFKKMWYEIENSGKWQGKIWDRRKNGEMYHTHLSIIKLSEKNNEETRYIGIFQDLSRFNITSNEQTYYDLLTGLPNRILLTDRLDFMLAHAKRNKQILALLIIDIDRFKATNDSLGYRIGDIILKEVAQRLKETLREVDAIFRLGNDEFAIILEEIKHVQDAAKVVKKVLASFSKPYKPDICKQDIYMSASIGISIFPHDGDDKEILLKNAEAALYRAKEDGENSYQHYTPSMNAKAFKTLTLEYRLHKALEQNEFLVYYQPQVELTTGKIVGAEALVRWKHPDLGLVSPADFIPIAEDTGLIIPIGEWVLKTACLQVKKWQDDNLGNIVISVNLSARQFQQKKLAEIVRNVLKDTNLSPEFLELEITESLGMKDAELTIATLKKLKLMGINISIDDFGTGYSSLSYLKRFPIDTLKIDQSFVRDIGNDENDEAIVAIILTIAHTLNLKVIAEGVERKIQLDFLKKQNCEQIQGYYFSPPVPAKDFEVLLKNGFDNY